MLNSTITCNKRVVHDELPPLLVIMCNISVGNIRHFLYRTALAHLVLVWQTSQSHQRAKTRLDDTMTVSHDDVIKWKRFPRYWPFARGIHRSPVDYPRKGQRRSFDIFFDLRLNKRLDKQSRRRCFETQSRSLWRHSNVNCWFLCYWRVCLLSTENDLW